MLKAFEEIKIRPISWIKAGTYGALLFLVYYSSLYWLVFNDWAMEDYSHCGLIPFVILYLLWEKRQKIAAIPSETSWTGLAPFCVGLCFFWLGELAGEFFSLYISFWFVVVGLVWLHLGWKKIKTIGFALAIMVAAFPFPNFITTRITFQLRLISSKLGIWMLHLYGMSAYREGNVIDLGFTQLHVVDACSGLRYVIPLAVLGLLLAYGFKAHWWKRVILFLSSIPFAIFVNSFRIAVTGILYSVFNTKVAEGFFHGFSGWFIFMFAIPCLLLEMWILRKIPPREQREMRNAKCESLEDKMKLEFQNTGQRNGNLKKRENGIKADENSVRFVLYSVFRDQRFIIALATLLLTFGLSHGIEFRQKIPISKPFNQFPIQIGEWYGTREDMEQQFLDVLRFSDYIILDYKNRQGKMINFYVAYYQEQRKGESIHSPETCLPAGGWEFREAGTATISLSNGKSMLINKAFIKKGAGSQLAYYWFPMRGRVLTKLYQIKIYNFWDSLLKQRTDGALVRVITPVYNGEEHNEASERLQGFIKEIVPVLDEYIPK